MLIKNMKQGLYSLIILLNAVTTNVIAQGPNLTNFTPASPSAQAFQRYGDIPVSAYTGVANISIPLYTVKFRDISVPISLSYHSSGIKVADEASQVGLGWVLNAGGNLSRSIIGYDDFDGGTYFNGTAGNNIMDFANGQGPTSISSTGCVLSMFNRSNAANNTLYTYDISSYINAVPQFDFQPDQYYYNVMGHSGKFLLLRNKQAVIQNQEKIQIYPTAIDGSTWEVKTADGYTYDFNAAESYHDNEFTTGGTASTHMTAWYLTTITSPLGNTVAFTYAQTSNYVTTAGGYSETRDDWQLGGNSPLFPVTGTGDQKGYNPSKQYYGQLLTSINFPTGKVVFNYSANRQDLPGDSQLDSISIYENGATTPDKTFALTYGYFNGTTDPSFNLNGAVTAQQSLRLQLTQVTEKGYYNGQFIQNPPYTFTYNQSVLPAKTSFARDHWGYFNGVTGRTTLIPDPIPLNATNAFIAELGIQGTQRDAVAEWTPAFALTQINYPTGGYTTFDYESNDFDEAKSEVNDASYFAKENVVVPQQTDLGYDVQLKNYLSSGQTLDLTNEYVNADGSYPQVSLAAAFRLTGSPLAGCSTLQLPANIIYFELRDANNNLLSHVDPGALSVCTNNNSAPAACIQCENNGPVFAYYQTYSLPPGVYTWTAFVNDPNNQYTPDIQDIHANYSWYSTPGTTTNNLVQGGGLRIQRITDHDGINEANNKVRHYIYDYYTTNSTTNTQSEFSYGRRMSKPEYYYFKISEDNNSQNTGSGCASSTYYTVHLMRSSDSDVPLNGSAAGAVVGYDQVTELEGENGEYGQKVYQYINNPDVINSWTDQYSGFNLPEAPPYGSDLTDMTNGSLLSETDYANVGGEMVVIRQVNSQYTTLSTDVSANGNVVYGLTNRALPTMSHGDGCATVGTSLCAGNEMFTYQSLQSAWNALTQTEEKLYDQSNANLLSDKVTNYYYDNPAHMQPTRTITTDSKGELLTTHMQYPLDFTNVTATDAFTTGVANLQNRFVVSVPVEKYFQRSNSDGSNNRTTNGILTYFNAVNPTPSSVYRTEITAPITNFMATTTGSSGIVANATYAPLLSYDLYDNYGNVLQQHKVGDMSTSYLRDYSASLPVCETRNASQSDIAFTSFEADGNGNWTITGGNVSPGGITGNNSYSLVAGASITNNAIKSSGSYMLSYWTTNASPYSIGGTVSGYPLKGKTINGWTYYEHKISGQSSVSISGTGNIDELRLYPASALMKTYTYTPLIGLTSECDVANRINYYFYDALGRLSYVKDQDGNIIKSYNYHYTGQSGN